MDTAAAYYCFINLGWPPSKYNELPFREKLLVTEFVLKALKEQKALNDRQKAR